MSNSTIGKPQSSHHLALAELSIAVSRRYALLVTGLCHSVVQVAHHLNFQVLHELQLLVLAGTELGHLLLGHYCGLVCFCCLCKTYYANDFFFTDELTSYCVDA